MALFLSTYSCASFTTLYIDVREPAHYTLEGEQKLGFLDRGYRFSWDSENKFHITQLLNNFYQGMAAPLILNNFQDTIPFLKKDTTIYVNSNQFPDIPAREDLFADTDCDNLIVMELCGYDRESARKGNFVAYLYVRLYNAYQDNPIYSYKFITDTDNSLFNRPEIRENGDEFVRDNLIPGWVPTTRRLYNGRRLSEGYRLYEENRIEEAFLSWEKVSSSRAQRVGSLVNIAWLYENENNFEMALEYLKKAKEVNAMFNGISNSYIKKYIQKLEKRMEDQEKLARQIK